MLDMHCHILPGIDDGAKDLEESLAMARMYVEQGYDAVIATPHYYKGRYDSLREHNEAALNELRSRLAEENIPLEVYLGNELYYEAGLDLNLSRKTVLPLAGSNYVLTEFPMSGPRPRITEFAYSLQMAGFVPIMAHVERYTYVADDPSMLIKYIHKDIHMQMNLDSLLSPSERIKSCARELLERQMIHLVATDAHSSEWRKPDPKEALEALKELVDEDYYKEIVHLNPYRIIENKRLITREPLEVVPKKKSFIKKLLGLGGK